METMPVFRSAKIRNILLCTLPMPLLSLWLCLCAQFGMVDLDCRISALWACFAVELVLSCAAVFLFSVHSMQAGAIAVTFVQVAILCVVWNLSALLLLLLSLVLAFLVQDRKIVFATGAAATAVVLSFVLAAFLKKTDHFAIPLAEADLEVFYSRTIPSLLTGIAAFAALFCAALHTLRELHYQKNMAYLNAKNEHLNALNKKQFQIAMKRLLNAPGSPRYLLVVTDFLQFRMFNDYFGYEAGDRLLRTMSELLAELAGEQGLVGHLGDDHLIALVPAEGFDKDRFSEEILHSPSITGTNHYRVEVVGGVYRIDDTRIAADVMCDRVLIACRCGKESKVPVTFYQENMLSSARRNLALLNDIVHALDTHQFIAYIQPQCDRSGNLLGGEVLARWQHPDIGIIMPGEFIPTCEECGLISRLDREMWERACQILHRWDEAGMPNVPLSVNISPLDLYELDIPKEIGGLIAQYQLTPDRLHLEITETTIMKDPETVLSIIRTLHEMGFTVELDDFGSGYSSLGMLSELEVDVIKLDMSFLRRLDVSPHGKNVLKMVADLVSSMHVQAVVEGVEKASHLELLDKMGYKHFQGMYFSAPIAVRDFESKYMRE